MLAAAQVGPRLPGDHVQVAGERRDVGRQRLHVSEHLTPAGGTRHDPVLAQWQYGLGRTAVWTPGAGSWSGGWQDSPLWNDTVRWLARALPIPALTPRLAGGGVGGGVEVDPLATAGQSLDLATLSGTVTAPGGRVSRLGFTQTGPSRYAADLPAGAAGPYRVTVRGPGGESAAELLAVPYPAEYQPGPDGAGLLDQLAARTGGQVRTDPDQGRPGAAVALWWPLTVIALLAFGAGIAVRRSSVRNRLRWLAPAAREYVVGRDRG